jgi:hypothetical protein
MRVKMANTILLYKEEWTAYPAVVLKLKKKKSIFIEKLMSDLLV